MQPFEDVVSLHGPVVMRICRAVLGSDASAEDAWSETFIAAMRSYADLRPDSNVRGWLVTIAHRKAIDQIRARNRAPWPTDQPIESAHVDEHPDVDDRLRAALDSLAPKQRSAVIYRYLADFSYQEIGELLDSNESAARRSAADGIARLRSTLMEEIDS